MKTRLIFLACFLTTLGAGVAAGVFWQRSQIKPPPDHWLGELNLTEDQRQKMKSFWDEAMKKNDWTAQREARESANRERDEAVQALFTPEQKASYDAILKKHQGRIDEMNQKSRQAREDAIAKTRSILTPEQQVKYDELRKKRFERGRRDGDKGDKGERGEKHGKGSHGPGDGPPPPPPGKPQGQF